MELREATSSDKTQVLDFCKNTFSWGDYIAEVWDFWIKEGNLLVTDYTYHQIIEISSTGSFIRTIGVLHDPLNLFVIP